MRRLEGKVALVTGASSGIGAALARELSRRGATLVLLARRADRIAALGEELGAAQGRAMAIPADVARDGDLPRAVAAALERFGRLDVVVANAGFGVAGPFARLTLDDYRRQMETNVFGVLRTAQAALPALRASRGTLVLIGSVSGHVSAPGSSPYSMSKFAVRALAEALRAELWPEGVATVLVSPGFVESEIRRVDNQGRLREGARDAVPAWLRLPADAAARRIARAILRRDREVVVTLHGKLLVLLARLCPGLLAWVGRRVAARPPRPREGAPRS
ncbi:MAG: SDR family oxidoreductase [Deltaproteobacteria bacterium]|nr:SDR family oxidoreductase [Deltaproteobacteria bacterium]